MTHTMSSMLPPLCWGTYHILTMMGMPAPTRESTRPARGPLTWVMWTIPAVAGTASLAAGYLGPFVLIELGLWMLQLMAAGVLILTAPPPSGDTVPDIRMIISGSSQRMLVAGLVTCIALG